MLHVLYGVFWQCVGVFSFLFDEIQFQRNRKKNILKLSIINWRFVLANSEFRIRLRFELPRAHDPNKCQPALRGICFVGQPFRSVLLLSFFNFRFYQNLREEETFVVRNSFCPNLFYLSANYLLLLYCHYVHYY